MKILDNKGKLFGKVSIIDLFVILMIIACIGGVFLKLKAGETVTGGDRTLTYEVKVNNLREVNVNSAKTYLKDLIDAENKKEIGDVIDIKESKARSLVQTNDGSYSFVEYDNRFDLVLTIKVQGTETDDSYFTASGRRLTVGDTIGINNGVSQFFGEIISVKAE